ncbi:hypothetical protein COCNU_scaffold008897G000020 [Cocos nucifera]|nr:hypothetical protein [Cocos nucifera]
MEEAQGGQSSKHHKMEKLDIGEPQPSFPERDVSKVPVSEAGSKAALFDEKELEEGEIREDELLMPDRTKMRYVDEELEEGEFREGLTSEGGRNAFEHYEASLEVSSSDNQEIGEAGVRVGQSSVSGNDDTDDFLHETSPDLTPLYDELEKVEIRESPVGHVSSWQPNLVEQDETPVLEPLSAKLHQQIRSLKDEFLEKQLDLINELYSRRLRTLLLKQHKELREFKTLKGEQQMELAKMKNLDLDLIHAMHVVPSVQDYRIKLLNEKFSKRMDEFDKHMRGQRKKLMVMHIEARNKENRMRDCWLEEAKAGILKESFYEIPLSNTGFELEKFKSSEHYGSHDCSGNNKAVAGSSSDLKTRPVESAEMIDRPTDSVPSCTNIVESSELSRPSPSILPLNQHGRAENMPLETEYQASHKMNAVCNQFDEGETEPGIAATVASKQHGGTGSSFVCLTDPTKQDQIEIPSFAHALKSSEGARSVLCNQVPSISEWEWSAVPRVRGDQGLSSFPNNVASALNSVDTGFRKNDPSINVSTVSNPILLGLPLSVGLASVMQGHGSSPAPVGIASDQIHCSTQLTEVSMQLPVVATAAQLEQSDCISSQPLSPPVGLALAVNYHASRPASVRSDQVPCNQVHCLVQPMEASMQQWLVLKESNHTSSQPLPPSIGLTSAVHGHPNRPSPVGSGLEPDGHIHCSAQLTEVSMQQPIVFAAAQWENSNHSLSHPFVHPMPPITDIPPARTHSEFLRSDGGQPERGSHFPLSSPIMQSMPPQDPNLKIFYHELKRLYALKALFIRRHEEKKLKLKLEYEKEIDNLKRKYDALIQGTEKEFVKRRKEIEMMYIKVSKHQELAGGFREIFDESIEEAGSAYQGVCLSTGQRFVQVLEQQHFAQRPVMASPSRSGPTAANVPPSQNPLPLSSVEVRHPSSNVVPVPPVQAMHSTPTVFSGNAVRFPPSSMAHSMLDLQIRSTPRELAPHLLTSTTSMSVSNLQHQNGSRLNQQQVFNDMGISLSTSEQILPISGSHQPEVLGLLHLRQSTSPSTSDFSLHLASSRIGVKRPNPDS